MAHDPNDFTESVKEQARKLAGFRCCLCRQNIGDHVHHLTPKEERGTGDLNNAILLCTRCHDLYGHRADWRERLRQAREDWYQMVPALFAPKVLERLEILDNLATKQDVQAIKTQVTRLYDTFMLSVNAGNTTSEQLANVASTMVSSISAQSGLVQSPVLNRMCPNCGVPFASTTLWEPCPTCGDPSRSA
jgi:hypothetical protein